MSAKKSDGRRSVNREGDGSGVIKRRGAEKQTPIDAEVSDVMSGLPINHAQRGVTSSEAEAVELQWCHCRFWTRSMPLPFTWRNQYVGEASKISSALQDVWRKPRLFLPPPLPSDVPTERQCCFVASVDFG